MQEKIEDIKTLNDKLIEYITKIQKANAELREDNLLNAMHIKQLRDKFNKAYNGLNDGLVQTNKNCDEFSQDLEIKFSESGQDNYAKFIKELLNNDFIAMQKSMAEDIKREVGLTSTVHKPKSNLISNISLVFSVLSFIFLLLLNFKFNLLSQLFG